MICRSGLCTKPPHPHPKPPPSTDVHMICRSGLSTQPRSTDVHMICRSGLCTQPAPPPSVDLGGVLSLPYPRAAYMGQTTWAVLPSGRLPGPNHLGCPPLGPPTWAKPLGLSSPRAAYLGQTTWAVLPSGRLPGPNHLGCPPLGPPTQARTLGQSPSHLPNRPRPPGPSAPLHNPGSLAPWAHRLCLMDQ